MKKSSFIPTDVKSFEAGVAFIVSGGSGPSPFLKTTVSSCGLVSPTNLTPSEGAGVGPEPPGLSYHSGDRTGAGHALRLRQTPWDEVTCSYSHLGADSSA